MLLRKKFLIITISSLLVSGFFLNSQVFAVQSSLQKNAKYKHNYIDGEVLVKYKEKKINLKNVLGQNKARTFALNNNFFIKRQNQRHNIALLKSKTKADIETLVNTLKSDSNVEYVQPNYRYLPTDISTNDTYRASLWGLENTGQNVNGIIGTLDADIDAPEAWAINEGTNSSTIVAIIDTGVAYNHPDLSDNMWDGTNCKDENGGVLGGCQHGYDYEDGDKIPLPTNSSHGTHVAGTIAAIKNNSKGIIGVAPQAKIMALKSSLTTDNIILAIDFAKQNGAKVINASWGGPSNDALLKEAIDNFPGLFVAAAGNEGTDNDSSHLYPCDFTSVNILCVAAIDQADLLASFSDFGITSVDIAAPGVNIFSLADDTDIYTENFEGVTPPALPAGWTSTGTINYWGTEIIGLSFGNVLIADVSSTYHDSSNSSAISPTIDITTSTGATIDFWARCDTQYITNGWADYMTLNFSTSTSFTEFLRWDEAQLDDNNGDSLISSGSATYHFQNQQIPAQYLTSTFKLSFGWVSDGTDNSYAGCWVDDITITSYSDGSDEKYTYFNGTSMATPHVAGLSALLWGYKPNLTVSQIKNTILTTGDFNTSTVNKTVTGKRINAYTAMQFITPPIAVTSSPTNSSTNIALTVVPTITFSKNINSSTLQNGIELRNYSTDLKVTSTIVAVSSTVASITPTSILSPSTSYYLFVSSSIQDTDGNNLEAVWTDKTAHNFTTGPDNVAPIITLTGSSTIYVEVGTIYTELGATATDSSVDGSISVTATGTVSTSTIGTYTIIYSATDSALNTATTSRSVIVRDTIPPVITLNGASTINLNVGNTYTELGATATDTINGSINVTTTGSVNTNVAGTYTIIYSATDLSTNSASSTRTVNVAATPAPAPAPSGGGGGGGGGGITIPVTPEIIVIATTTIVTSTLPIINNPIELLPSSTVPSQFYLFNEPAVITTAPPKTKIQTLLGLVKFGNTNKNVKLLQLELVRLGFLPKKFSATNYYGKITNAAVKKYLASLPKKIVPVNTTNQTKVTINKLITIVKYGSKNKNVTQLQTALKKIGVFTGSVTGYFGPVTRTAVQKYLKMK